MIVMHATPTSVFLVWVLCCRQTLCLVSLQDAQAGRNVIECLLQYLGKGGHWADTSSLRSIAIGITRKVQDTLPLASSSLTA